jgi:hypothetical protein
MAPGWRAGGVGKHVASLFACHRRRFAAAPASSQRRRQDGDCAARGGVLLRSARRGSRTSGTASPGMRLRRARRQPPHVADGPRGPR